MKNEYYKPLTLTVSKALYKGGFIYPPNFEHNDKGQYFNALTEYFDLQVYYKSSEKLTDPAHNNR